MPRATGGAAATLRALTLPGRRRAPARGSRCIRTAVAPRSGGSRCTDETAGSQRCWASRPTPHSWSMAEPAPKPVSAHRQSRGAEGGCSVRGGRGSGSGPQRRRGVGMAGSGRTSIVRVDSLPQVSLDQYGVWSTEHNWAGRREGRAGTLGIRPGHLIPWTWTALSLYDDTETTTTCHP